MEFRTGSGCERGLGAGGEAMKILTKPDGSLPAYIRISTQYSQWHPPTHHFAAHFEDGLRLHIATSDYDVAKSLRDEIEAEGMILDIEGRNIVVYRRNDAAHLVVPEQLL